MAPLPQAARPALDRIYGQQLASLGLGSVKEHQGVNINALGFAGMVLVTDRTNPPVLGSLRCAKV